MLGYGAAAAFFALFFGGGLLDFLAAGACGLAVGCCLIFGKKLLGSNLFFRTVLCAAVAAGMALMLIQSGVGENFEVVTIGTLMLLVPGMALTNAMREIVNGDIISGINRTAEAILTAAAISLR